MTTIGTAVLQIIPSLKGVTDAIEKQIDGKVVEVKVAPKVDKQAAEAAGRETRAGVEKHTKQVTVQPKVDKAATKKAGKEVGESIAKEAKTAVGKVDIGKGITDNLASSVKKSSTGNDLAKVIFEGLADGVKQGLGGVGGNLGDNIVDDITDSVKSAAKKNKVGAALGGEFTDGLIDSLSKSLRGGNVGKTVTDALNGLGADISGPVTAITGSLAPLKDALSAFKDHDIAGGVQGTAEGLKQLEDVGVPEGLADTMSQLADPLEKIASGSKAEKVQGIADGLITMAPAIEDMTGLDLSGVVGNLEKVSAIAGSFAVAAEGMVALKGAAIALGGPGVIASLGSFVLAAAPLAAIAIAIKNVREQIAADNARIKSYADAYHDAPDLPGRQQALDNSGLNGTGTGPNKIDLSQLPKPGTLEYDFTVEEAKAGHIPGVGFENGKFVERHATGGGIRGPGGPTSDIIPIWASNGEFIVNAAAAQKNMALLEFINSGKMPKYGYGGRVAYGLPDGTNTGGYGSSGSVFPDWVHEIENRFGVKASTYPGHQEKSGLNKGIDWSGPVDKMQAFAEYLASIHDQLEQVIWMNPNTGQQIGVADGQLVGPGTSQPGYYRADWAGHTNHVHTRQSYSFGGSTRQPLTDVAPAAASSDQTSTAPPVANTGTASGGSLPLPSSISGLSSFGLNSLGAGVGKTGAGSDLSLFGKAAGTAVSGQIASALGVGGIGDNPPFLQAASKLIGGIKVGGKGLFDGGSSAVPLSATSTATGAMPDDMHGNRAGQQPGPVFNTTISAFDTTDALRMWDSKKNQMLAAQTGPYG